MVLLR